jgi:hypothetical protein
MEGMFGWIIGSLLIVVPMWRICGRAGFNPALGLLSLVPWLGFLIVSAALAFLQWPATKSPNASGD